MIELKLPKGYLNNIPFFITGSRRFGTDNDKSDLDIVVCNKYREEILTRTKNPKHSNYNNGFTFYYKNLTINIIPLHPLDYVCWFYAAKLMILTPNKDDKIKAELHGLHQTYVGLMKFWLSGEMINNDNYIEYCK